jgi:hypothetical protein
MSQLQSSDLSRLSRELRNSESADLWITDRAKRVFAYQQVAEMIYDQLREYRDVDDTQVNPFDPNSDDMLERQCYLDWKPEKKKPLPAMLVREFKELLRTTAEEMGQLPAPGATESDPTQFVVSGISDAELASLR